MSMSVFCSAALIALSHSALFPVAQAPEAVDTLVSRALIANPAILAARQKVSEAESRLAEMQGHRKLQLSLSGTGSGSSGQVAQPTSSQSFASVEASLTAPLPNFARAGAEVEQAAANVDVAKTQYRRTLLDVEFRTTSAAFELKRAQDAEDIAQQNLDQAMRLEADTKSRIDQGDLPPADLLKAQVPVAQSRAAFARAKSELKIARQNLNDLLQRDLNASLTISTGGAMIDPQLQTAEAITEALRQGPDVVEAMATVRAAEANERIVRRGRDPDVSLQLSHVRTGDPTAYGYLSTLGVTITLPLADGGSNRELVHQARLQTDQARTALLLARQRTRLAVEQAVLNVESDEANVEATAQTASIARESLTKSRQSFAAGLTLTRDVLDAQLVLSQSLIEANSARYDLAIAQARLRQLLGALPK